MFVCVVNLYTHTMLGTRALQESGYSVCWICSLQWNLTGMVEWLISNFVARVSPGRKVPLLFLLTFIHFVCACGLFVREVNLYTHTMLGIRALKESGYSVCWICSLQWNLTGMVEWLTSNFVARVSPGRKVPLLFLLTFIHFVCACGLFVCEVNLYTHTMLGIRALKESGYSVCWICSLQWNLTGMVEWLTSNFVARVSPGHKVPLLFRFTVLIQ